MKDITNKIFEAKQSLVSEVQNEYGKDYAYQTFNYSDGEKKYDYGFLAFDKDNGFYSVTAFNKDSEDAAEFADGFNLDLDELQECGVGDTIGDASHGPNYVFAITRIW